MSGTQVFRKIYCRDCELSGEAIMSETSGDLLADARKIQREHLHVFPDHDVRISVEYERPKA